MSDYDEIYHTETNDQDELDLAAHEEAHKILSGEIPSSPKTYAMVQKWYAPGNRCVVAKEKHGCNICGYYESDKRSCTSKYETAIIENRSTSFG